MLLNVIQRHESSVTDLASASPLTIMDSRLRETWLTHPYFLTLRDKSFNEDLGSTLNKVHHGEPFV